MKTKKLSSKLLSGVNVTVPKKKGKGEKILLITALLCLHSTAFAAGGDTSINDAVQGVLAIMTGVVAETIATIAIAATGWAWMTSQISLKTATIIGMGIGIVFGASEIATALGAHG